MLSGSLRPHAGYDSYWNFDGLLESSRVHLDQHWQLRAGHEFHTGMNITREGVTTPFEIYPDIFVPVGNYENSEAQLVAFTNQGAPLSVRQVSGDVIEWWRLWAFHRMRRVIVRTFSATS